VHPQQGIARRGHDGGQAGEALHGCHAADFDAPASRPFHAVGHRAVAFLAQPREREGGAREVTAKTLASYVIVGAQGDGGVEVEALEGHRLLLLRGVRGAVRGIIDGARAVIVSDGVVEARGRSWTDEEKRRIAARLTA
jgi:hypothetical protein